MTPCPLPCKFDCEYEEKEFIDSPSVEPSSGCPYQRGGFTIFGIDYSIQGDGTVKERWHGEVSEGNIRTHEPTGDAIPFLPFGGYR